VRQQVPVPHPGDDATPENELDEPSSVANGSSVQIPAASPIVPASHGSAEPPITDTAFVKPTAAGTSRGEVSSGTTATAVGKRGPRKNPSSANPAVAAAPTGLKETSTPHVTTAARQTAVMRATVQRSRAAVGLMTNRPTVSPSQYPLTEPPARPAVRS